MITIILLYFVCLIYNSTGGFMKSFYYSIPLLLFVNLSYANVDQPYNFQDANGNIISCFNDKDSEHTLICHNQNKEIVICSNSDKDGYTCSAN